MSSVRPFVADDIPQVADLHRRVFRTAEPTTTGWREAYQTYFSDVFLRNPLHDDTLTSLVAEDGSGTIVGFLGVVPRRMVFKGQSILAAVCSQFMVDPARRGQVGLRMVKQCLAGPQDLSMTDEAEDSTGKVWQWCGGIMALLHSMHWIRPLRPAHAALALLGKRMRLARLAAAAPMARIVDAHVTRVAHSPFQRLTPRGSREDLDAGKIIGFLPEVVGDRSLRPDYDDGLVQWMLGRAGRLNGHGELRTVLVRDDAHNAAGWYVYYANPGQIGEVLQIAARAPSVHLVLDHLLDDAAERGVVALAGRLDPPFARELSEKYFVLHRRGFSMFVHSKRPELMDAIWRGDAFLTRLDGEWCLHLR